MAKISEHKELIFKKTKPVVFASCTKPRVETQANQNVESSAGRNDAEPINNDSFAIKSVSSNDDLEEEDVFLWNQPRRGSAPVLLKRNGNAMLFRLGRQRPNKLRSLSEGVPLPADRSRVQPRELARSASDTPSTHSQLINFSPTVVKKINLSSSLQDWLSSEKQTGDQAGNNVPKNTAKRLQTRSNDENFDQICNESKSIENYPYRRRSADTVGKKSGIDGGRRPSAPPALSDKGNNKLGKNVQGRSHILPCNNSEMKFDSAHEAQIYSLIKEELQSRLMSVNFCAQSCRKWCEEISEVMKERIQVLLSTPCKIVCTIYIGALRDHGIHTASQATAGYKLDYHVSAYYQNESLFAVVSVLVVRYGGR